MANGFDRRVMIACTPSLMRPTSAWLAAACIVVAVWGCRPPGSERGVARDLPAPPGQETTAVAAAPTTTNTGAPRLTSLSPSEARLTRGALVQLVIAGERFDTSATGKNTVDVGPVHLEQVPSESSGTRIRIVLPDRFTSSGGAPPRPMLPGDYTVTVTTPAGSSNSLPFRVVP